MRIEICIKCPMHKDGNCLKRGLPIKRVKGCSLSDSGKLFFRAKRGDEAFRLNVLSKRKERKEKP